MAHVLIIEDDAIFSAFLSSQLTSLGHDIAHAPTLKDGLLETGRAAYDLVLLDLQLPDGNSLDHIEAIRAHIPEAEIIVVSGNSNPDFVSRSIEAGAMDYLIKPVSHKALKTLVDRVVERRKRRQEFVVGKDLKRDEIIGDSPKLLESLAQMSRAAFSDINVLITGETGTGKELFARAIHFNSKRADKNFVVVDCTNIPATLVESILFGHMRDSFTGARSDREGLFAAADGGTIFLDEVGDLPLETQKSLLRVIQERRFRPVGSSSERTSNFRIISATNRDLGKLAMDGAFRKDLYYRLNALTMQLPPLRERMEDIKTLLEHFTGRICKELGVGKKVVSEDFLLYLQSYSWPGNIRELVNVLYRAVTDSFGETKLYPHHLPSVIRAEIRKNIYLKDRRLQDTSVPLTAARPAAPAAPGAPDASARQAAAVLDPLAELFDGPEFPSMKDVRVQTIDRMEAEYMRRLMQHVNGDVNKACAISELSRARIYQLLKKFKQKP